jgi:hypothetical protein
MPKSRPAPFMNEIYDWKSKSEDANALFASYLAELAAQKPSHEDVMKSFPVYVGYIAIARMLALYELYKQTKDLSGHIAEVGTFRGATLHFVGKLIRIFEPNSNTQAHGFDWFQGMTPGAADNKVETGRWQGDYERLVGLTKAQGLDDTIIVHKMDVSSALQPFLQQHDYMRFKFVFLDCGLQHVLTAALPAFWEKLVPGGVLIMDHYNHGVSPSESALVDRVTGGAAIQQVPFARQPTGYIIKPAC